MNMNFCKRPIGSLSNIDQLGENIFNWKSNLNPLCQVYYKIKNKSLKHNFTCYKAHVNRHSKLRILYLGLCVI